MSNQVAILLVAGLIAAVLLALVLNRSFKAWWGDKGVQTGVDGTAPAQKGQEMTASGRGASIERAAQVRNGSAEGNMTMRAERGGTLKDVQQHVGSKENEG